MLCSYCDAPMPDVSVFCPACGRSIDSGSSDASELRARILGALAYFCLFPAVVLLGVPVLRKSSFLRFHSWQAILFTVASLVIALVFRLLYAVFSVFPVFGLLIAWLIAGIGSLGLFTLWLVLAVKAAQGQRLELPFIGALSMRLADKNQADQ